MLHTEFFSYEKEKHLETFEYCKPVDLTSVLQAYDRYHRNQSLKVSFM